MTVLDDLRQLSSAEDFFHALEVEYDPRLLSVARLHILRRMGQYLKGIAADDAASDAALRERCRSHLQQAYQDFIASTPLEQRVFKVLQDAVKPAAAPAPAFVSLDALTRRNG